RFDESFSEAWDRFKDLLRACPHHGFLKLHQLDTFYNALNSKDQDSLNSAAGGNFLEKMPRECLAIIESKSKVRYLCNKSVVANVSTNTSTFGISPDVAELKDMVKALLLDKKSHKQAPTTVKAVKESCVTYGGAHSYRNCPAIDGNVYRQNMQNQLTDLLTMFVNTNSASTLSSSTLPSNTIANTRSDLKAITTRSGVSYDGPQILSPSSFLPKVVENEPEATKDTVHLANNESTEDIQPQVIKSKSLILTSEPVNSPFSKPVNSPDKLSELARTPLNEHCSAILLKKFPEKLGDPGKFLIRCDFPRKAECLALVDLGASINLMPLSVWNKLFLPNLSYTCMTLELADRSISHPVGVAEDVYIKVGTFYLTADFVVVNFDADPRVPLIIGRSFLKTRRALIDVFKGELTLRVGNEAITFNLDQTSRYSTNYNDMTAKRIDVIDMDCEDDFLFEEVDAFLAIKDDPTLTKVDQSYLDPERDILLLEAFLNDDPSLPPPNQGNYLPEVRKELKICEAKSDKSSIDEPPGVELKDLPPYLEYAFLKVHCVPKKGGFTVVENEENELIPNRLVTSLRVCIVYRKLNEATSKDHFPLLLMDQMLERLVRNQYYNFLDGFSGYFQIPIDPKDQEKTTFTCPYGTCAYRRMPFSWLSHLERMLKRCKDINLCLNWEKSHFMVKEGIVPGHKISKQGIEVDKAKVDVITKLPHQTTVKECVEAFQTLKRNLTNASILIAPDWDMPFELMCDASDFAISAVLGQRQDKNFRLIHYARENRASWLDKLDDALWAFRTAYKIPIGYTPYNMVYGKACHLLIELKHKDYYALTHANFDLQTAVLLFNSQLKIFSGKLKSCWSGPFSISYVYPYGTVELAQTDGHNFKVNGHRLKHYFVEDVPKMIFPDLHTFPNDH
nr:DNA-directed DNA polymerase [Tanacetum cinerariifolium]